MAESAAAAVVIAYQDAWTSGDFGAARRLVDDDVVFRSSGGQLIKGCSAFFFMLSAFAQRIQPRWEKVALLEDDGGVLIIYRLFTDDGTPAFCADYFTLGEGKIKTDTLVFDPVPFIRPAR